MAPKKFNYFFQATISLKKKTQVINGSTIDNPGVSSSIKK